MRVGWCSAGSGSGGETKGGDRTELKEDVVQGGSLSCEVFDKQLAPAVESLVGTKCDAAWSEPS